MFNNVNFNDHKQHAMKYQRTERKRLSNSYFCEKQRVTQMEILNV